MAKLIDLGLVLEEDVKEFFRNEKKSFSFKETGRNVYQKARKYISKTVSNLHPIPVSELTDF